MDGDSCRPDGVTDEVTGAVVALTRAHRAHVARMLAGLGLQPGQEFTLVVVAGAGADGVRQHELATSLGIEPATVSRSVTRLVDAGLLARGPDPDSGRAVRVVATPEGRRIAARVPAVWRRASSDATRGLGEREVATFVSTCHGIAHNLSRGAG